MVVQVLRYSALFAGIFYGVSHQAAISSSAKTAQLDHEYKTKADLIAKAKAAFTKKNLPADKKTESGDRMCSPLEAVLLAQGACLFSHIHIINETNGSFS